MTIRDDIVFRPSTPPPLTGTPTIYRPRRTKHLVIQLLGLPNGVRFRGFKFLWETEPDGQWVMDLVEASACFDTLEHIDLEPQANSKSHQSCLLLQDHV
jgi:hypothetical protein